MAQEMGLGLVVWSPFANGLLTGKYSREELKLGSDSRLVGTRKSVITSFGELDEKTLAIVDEVKKIATEEHLQRLDAMSAIELGFPHKHLLNHPVIQEGIFGGVPVEHRRV